MKKVLAISSVLLGVVFLAGCGQQQTSQTQQPAPSAPATQQKEQSVTNQPQNNQPNSSTGIVYTNPEFGFKLNLPAGWDNYKVSVQKSTTQKGYTNIHVLLPTTDASWPGHYISDTETMKGYVSMFAIGAWDASLWNQEKNSKDCKNDPNPGCLNESAVVAKNNKYVFDITGAQDYPSDLQAMIPTSGFTSNFLKGKFDLPVN